MISEVYQGDILLQAQTQEDEELLKRIKSSKTRISVSTTPARDHESVEHIRLRIVSS